MGRDEKICTKFSSEKLKGIDHMEEFKVDGRILLEWILSK
jgi:hypothetical protein